ncbi:YcnI family protein [Nitriliruptor alkaliphilus]|uniref:YcnI family protein n=1 Tax=Nitriliruptor alkaliphilus TaxID=427918 RepID=UPI0006976857|nr:YcnI family protein [Nitriliruptor alkaliphilus]
MRVTTRRRATTSVLLGSALTLLLAGPAAAHVTANPSSTAAGSYAVIDMRVPHGCEGAATNVLEVQIPDGVISVKPEHVPGWTATTEIGPYDEPVELHGSPVTEGVKVVTWTADEGQELADDQYREFGLSVRLPDAAGETLTIPAVQTCVDGAEEAWIETSDDPDADLAYPAPQITLTAGGGGHGGGADEADEREEGDDSDEEHAAGDGTEVTATPAGSEQDGGTDALVYVALAIGLLGLVVGGAGLRTARASR